MVLLWGYLPLSKVSTIFIFNFKESPEWTAIEFLILVNEPSREFVVLGIFSSGYLSKVNRYGKCLLRLFLADLNFLWVYENFPLFSFFVLNMALLKDYCIIEPHKSTIRPQRAI